MEDAATAEIARAQIWQWIHHGSTLERRPHRHRASSSPGCSTRRPRRSTKRSATRCGSAGRPRETREVLEAVALGDDLPEFLTLGAYELLD